MVEELRHVVVGNFDKIMRVFVTKDVKGTGLLAMQDFTKALYLELGVAPAHLDVIFSSIGCSDSGFMDYAEWLRYVAATPMPMVADFRIFYRPSTMEPGMAPPPPRTMAAEAHQAHLEAMAQTVQNEKQMAVREEHMAAEQL